MSRPRLTAALFLSAAVLGFTAAPAMAQDELELPVEGPVWDLVVPDESLTGSGANLALADGTAAVHGGCNTYFGSYELDGDSLTFGELAGTRMACGPAETAVEDYFLGALEGVAGYAVLDDGTLQLLDADGNVSLTFVEEVVATAGDIGEIEFELERIRTHIQSLRERIATHDVRDEVAALEAHVNELTKQHLNNRAWQREQHQRIRSLEQQVATLTRVLADEGLIPMTDSQ